MKTITCALLLLLVPQAPSHETKMGEIAGRPVALNVVRADTLSPAAWPAAQIELTQISGTVTPDVNIYMLLQDNGIAPDSGAFAIVYDLNPTIRDINLVAPNTALRLPAVRGGEALRELLQDGYLIQLTVDPELRRQLNQQIDALQSLATSAGQVTSEPAVKAQLTTLIAWYQQIEKRFQRKTDPPLRNASIVQLLNEAELLNSILQDALRQRRQFADQEKRQIAAIHADVRLEMTQYGQILAGAAPKPEGFYSVTVNVNGRNLALIKRLRVYYTYNGLFRPLPAHPPVISHGFKELGSGKTENLLMKNYWLWAAPDGDANNPATPPYELRIEPASPISFTVDLSLKDATTK